MSTPFFLDFIYNQFFARLPYPTTSFSGQTIIVTGSNVGLGLEAARHFIRLNAAKVVLAVRDVDKGNAAKSSIEDSTGLKDNNTIEVWSLDLSSYESVQAFAKKARTLSRLDVLLENAGIATKKYQTFEDNESTLTVNVISTFLLALLLLPKMRETAQRFNNIPRPPHLVIVSSEVHSLTPFAEKDAPEGKILDTLNDKATANMEDRYPMSKLLEVFFTRELAARCPPPSQNTKGATSSGNSKGSVIINFVTPGLCHSELGRDEGIAFYLMKLLLARSTEVGSRALVHASMAEEESHGQYLKNCKVTQVAPLVSRDESEMGGKLQRRVWDEVLGRLEKIQPGITKNL